MRILHVVPAVSVAAGGPNNLVSLVRSLNEHGVDTTLLTNADRHDPLDAPLNQVAVRDGVPYVFHHVWAVGGRYGLAPSMMRTLRQTIASYDLVHIHWLYSFSCVVAARAARRVGVPFVVQPHGSLDPHLRRKNRVVKAIYMATIGRPLMREAAAVVFDTHEEGRLAVYAPRRREWVTPTGVDPSRFAPLPPRGTFRAAFPAVDGPFLLFLGRLSPQKGLDLLLAAFERLRRTHDDLWLVVAGPGYRGYEADVRHLARRLGIDHRVLFTGMLPDGLKLAALVDAELFVLPSYAENFGTVIMEALICGLPVVISDRVNIHNELSGAGVATVVAVAQPGLPDERSIEAVAAGIRSALADPDLRRRIATAGPAFVEAHYTWDVIVPTLMARYEDVIKASAGRTDR